MGSNYAGYCIREQSPSIRVNTKLGNDVSWKLYISSHSLPANHNQFWMLMADKYVYCTISKVSQNLFTIAFSKTKKKRQLSLMNTATVRRRIQKSSLYTSCGRRLFKTLLIRVIFHSASVGLVLRLLRLLRPRPITHLRANRQSRPSQPHNRVVILIRACLRDCQSS